MLSRTFNYNGRDILIYRMGASLIFVAEFSLGILTNTIELKEGVSAIDVLNATKYEDVAAHYLKLVAELEAENLAKQAEVKNGPTLES